MYSIEVDLMHSQWSFRPLVLFICMYLYCLCLFQISQKTVLRKFYDYCSLWSDAILLKFKFWWLQRLRVGSGTHFKRCQLLRPSTDLVDSYWGTFESHAFGPGFMFCLNFIKFVWDLWSWQLQVIKIYWVSGKVSWELYKSWFNTWPMEL